MSNDKEYPIKIKIAAKLLLESLEEMNMESSWVEHVSNSIDALYPILKELPNVAIRKPRK